MLQDFKSPIQSVGIWGGLIAQAAGVGSLLGYTITEADQAQVIDLIEGLLATIGGSAAIWGRIRATKRIA